MEAIHWPEGAKPILEIVHVESPSAIFIRDDNQDRIWIRLGDEMEVTMKRYWSQEASFSSKDDLKGQLVMIKKKDSFYRGRVVTVQDIIICLLIDLGRKEIVSLDNIKALPKSLKKLKPLCTCLSMDGIIPSGSNNPDQWTMTAIETLQKILHKYAGSLAMKKQGKVDQNGTEKILVDLLYEEKIVTDPFAPVEIKIIDVKNQLIESGLALVPRKSAGDDDNAGNISFDMSGHQMSSTPKDSFIGGAEDQSEMSWHPPMLPDTSCVFRGEITFIDGEGQFYIQTEQGQEIADAIADVLTKIHSEIPSQLDNMYAWYPGSPLIAKYEADDTWNRAVVMEACKMSGKIKVLFVDFGEILWLDPKQNECHKTFDPIFKRIPIQALRCKLENIVPNNDKYDESFIKSMNDKYTGQQVQVRLTRKNTKMFPLAVILHLIPESDEDKSQGDSAAKAGDDKAMEKNLARIFVQNGAAKIMKSRMEWYEPQAVQRQNELAFDIQPVVQDSNFDAQIYDDILEIADCYPCIPELELNVENQFIPVDLIDAFVDSLILQPRLKGANIEIKDLYVTLLKAAKHQYLEMQRSIDKEIDKMDDENPVMNAVMSHAYLCKNANDGLWYRCVVYDISSEDQEISVFFPDIGRTQESNISQLKHLPLKHMKVPQQNIYVIQQDIDAKLEFLKNQQLAVQWKNDRYVVYYRAANNWRILEK